MDNYKVCILTAGVGSRMGSLSDYINKAVLPVNFKATISYLIEKVPNETEIVVAVGHKKETVMDYLTLTHPEKKISYVEVDNYVGPGTGPGYSLLACREKLQCPFVFVTSDTIVLEDIPKPDQNWLGIAQVKDTEKYCTLKMKNNLIYQLDDKIKTDNQYAFIGLAGVHDYDAFFDGLEKSKELMHGEARDIIGFKKLIEKKLVPVEFTWFDTGSIEKYIDANKAFAGEDNKFDFGKGNEFLYFVNDKVIKFFADEKIARNRCERAEHLKGIVPKIEGERKHFYMYNKVNGHTLYDILNNKLLSDFLYWAKANLWKPVILEGEEKEKFANA